MKCVKHKRRAAYVWRICSLSKDEGVCHECDLELNKLALKWRYPKSWKPKFEKYRKMLEDDAPF